MHIVLLQIQHPRWGLDQFDMVITPLHDYHALSPAARQEVPKLIRPWITPQYPPDKHVVRSLLTWLLCLTDRLLLTLRTPLLLYRSKVNFLRYLSLATICWDLNKLVRTGADSWGLASRGCICLTCSCYYLAGGAGAFGKATSDC